MKMGRVIHKVPKLIFAKRTSISKLKAFVVLFMDMILMRRVIIFSMMMII